MHKREECKKIFINSTEGCSRRKLDARRFAEYFLKNGHYITNNPKEADEIILYTCGATNYGSEKSYKDIENLKKYNGKLIVAGCVPDIEPENLKNHWDGTKISTRILEDNPEFIDKLFPENKIKFQEIGDQITPWITIDESNNKKKIQYEFLNYKPITKIFGGITNHLLINFLGNGYMHIGDLIEKVPGGKYSTVRVSWGCQNKCTYCAIRRAIGDWKSKPINECLNEFEKCVKIGYKDIFLNSDDIGSYGIDIGSSFPELLNKLTNIKGDYKLRINALNPVWIIKYIDDIVKILKKGKIYSMLCPIQSGSSRILKMMHRYSNTDKMISCFRKLKSAYPKLSLCTQIIIGFPSETENEFHQTLDFIDNANIDMGSFYKMSLRPMTQAINFNPKISESEMDKRADIAVKYLRKKGYMSLKYSDSVIFGRNR